MKKYEFPDTKVTLGYIFAMLDTAAMNAVSIINFEMVCKFRVGLHDVLCACKGLYDLYTKYDSISCLLQQPQKATRSF